MNGNGRPHLRSVPNPAAGLPPPNDLDAEASVLGAIMLDSALDKVADRLSAEDFYATANGKIFAAAKQLWSVGKPTDVVTVKGVLADWGELDRVGGVGYLAQLIDTTPHVSNVEAYADRVLEKARVRRMIAACQHVAAEGYSDVGEVSEWLCNAEQRICDVTKLADVRAMVHAQQAMKATFERISKAVHEGRRLLGTPSGFDRLDKAMGGLTEGSLTILAARPGMGKSALALNIALNAAAAGFGVGFFSLEMTNDELVARMACSESRSSLKAFREGNVHPNDWPKLAEAAQFVSALPLWLDESSGVRPVELRAKVRRLASECQRLGKPLKLVIVDYVHLMDGSDLVGENATRDREIGKLTAGLKQLAKEAGVAVIALSQLSRALESRKDKRPQLSDLRESGNLEQDADAVLFIYRDDYYDSDSDTPGLAELILAKQRNGPTCRVFARWTGSYCRFDNLADHEHPENDNA